MSKYFKSVSSGGPDGLPASFFIYAAGSIAFPLSIIFSLSLQTGDIPDIWSLLCLYSRKVLLAILVIIGLSPLLAFYVS